MSLLDTILSNMETGPRIVAQEHDTSRIRVEAADIDRALAARAGAWDAAEYGISRERAAEMLAGADTPEARERVLADLRQRAIRRASLDTSTGKVAVVVVGDPAWHRLGVNVASALTARDAIRLASLDWAVSKRALSFRRSDGVYVESGESFALVRDDTEAQLGTVGTRYRAIQNAEGFDFLDSVTGEFNAHYHTAGAIYNGGKVWMQCALPGQSFEVVRGDRVDAYATFTNPHDGSGKAWCFPTTNRIVCANTFRTASRDRSAGLGIRHTGDVRASITDARQALGLAVREIDQFKDAANVMARTPCDAPVFFQGLLDAVLDVTQAQAVKGADALAAALNLHDADRRAEEAKRFQRQIDSRRNVLDDILSRYDSDRCGVGGIRGSQWATFNAVTEHADYAQPRRAVGTEADRLSRRFESSLTGDADELKQTAFRMLTAAR